MKKWWMIVMVLLACGYTAPLHANLPCEDGCEDECDCDEEGEDEGGDEDDASPGNDSASGGTGGAAKGSVSIWVNWGAPANENIKGKYRFSIYTKKPTPMIYSPQIIQYRNLLLDRINISEINQQYKQDIRGDKYASVETGYSDGKVVAVISNGGGQEKLMTSLPSDVTHQVKIFTADRQMMTFQFKTGSSIGIMVGENSNMNNLLKMVNASGAPTTTNPVYYDRYLGHGNFLRYSAETGNVVSYHTAMGRIVTPDAITVGVQPIYDTDGTIRQVWSLGDGLADVVVTEPAVSYEIRCYAPDKVGAKTDGVYTVTGDPHTVWRIENPNPGTYTKVKVTKTVNGVSEISLFEYSHNSEGWLLKKPGDLAIDSQTTSWDYSKTVKVVTSVEKSPDGQIASKVARTYQKFAFGDRIVNVSVDPDGANLRTQTTYYTNSGNTGSYGRKETENFPDGNWASYKYDAQGRETVKITPWKNAAFNSPAAQAKAVYRSFAPLDSRDIVENDDVRPRTEETKILGITTSKTYHAYYFDGNEYVEIEERCVNGNAAYGDATNLRTERRYYAKGNCTSPSAGRIHTIKYPIGTMDTYTYEYGTWTPNSDPAQSTFVAGNGAAIRVKITHGTVTNPQGIANKTTQDSTVYDTRGCTAYTTQSVYTGSYEQFAWVANTFDEQRRQLSKQKSNNELTEYTWNCCAKASETLPDGTQYTYVYDALKRMVSKTLVGIGNMPDYVTSYTYDAANHRISETISGGDLSTTAAWEYNSAGQLTKNIDHKGLVTIYSYTQGTNTGNQPHGEKITTTLPGGAQVIMLNYCDKKKLSQTGSSSVNEFYDYGIENNGTTWNIVRVGFVDSPRFQKTSFDCIDRIVSNIIPGFGGNIIKTYTYNTRGQLTNVETTDKPTIINEYDQLGNLIRRGYDLNGNNILDLAANDYIIEQNTVVIQENSDWYKVLTQKTYGTTGNDTATTLKRFKQRLNGWNENITAELQTTDIHGNTTLSQTITDRARKQITQKVTSPISTISQEKVYINGLWVSQTSTSGLITTYVYDSLRRQVSITAPRTGTTSISYHTDVGKIGLRNSITDPAGNTTLYDYDPVNGRIIWMKNALNQYTRYAYNHRGEVIQLWGDTIHPVMFGYDAYGQMTDLWTYRENATWNAAIWPHNVTGDHLGWTYDSATGLVTAKTDAAGKITSYNYNLIGNLIKRTWARTVNGVPLYTEYSHDQLGNLLEINYSDETPDVTFSYNRVGLPVTVIDATGTRILGYNANFNLISETITGIYSKVLSKNYTNSGFKGRIASMQIGDVINFTCNYDNWGRLNQLATPAGNFFYIRQSNSDLVSQLIRPNGVNTSWNYEPYRDYVTEITNGTISSFGYTNNEIGNRTKITRNGNAFALSDELTYQYDSRNEVTQVQSNADSTYNYRYSYDPIGNRLTASLAEMEFSYISNNLNQYIAINTEAPTYDDDGNMLTRDGWRLVWNGENRLIEANKDSQHLIFVYDCMGRRIEKKVYDETTLVQHTKFLYDGHKLVEELDGLNNNSIIRQYTWSPELAMGLDVPLLVCKVADNTKYFYSFDANRNISDLTDENGIIVAHYEYSPFGKLTKRTGVFTTENPLSFSSEYYDTETQLIYYNYRYYDPQIGKWLKRDPIENDGGYNFYEFVNNNPINLFDSLGLKGWDVTDYERFRVNCDKCKENKEAEEKRCMEQIGIAVAANLATSQWTAASEGLLGIAAFTGGVLAGWCPLGWGLMGLGAGLGAKSAIDMSNFKYIPEAGHLAQDSYCHCP